jgi:hypothetical protein
VLDVLLLLLTLLALVLGGQLSRVSLCAVARIQHAVATGNFSGLERLALAGPLSASHYWLADPGTVN